MKIYKDDVDYICQMLTVNGKRKKKPSDDNSIIYLDKIHVFIWITHKYVCNALIRNLITIYIFVITCRVRLYYILKVIYPTLQVNTCIRFKGYARYLSNENV